MCSNVGVRWGGQETRRCKQHTHTHTHTHIHKQEHPHFLQSTVQTNYDFMKTVPFAIHIF